MSRRHVRHHPPLRNQLRNAGHDQRPAGGIGVEFWPDDFGLGVDVGQADMGHRPFAVMALGDAFAVDQLQIGVARVGKDARVEAGDFAPFALQCLQKYALPFTKHAGDVVLGVPGVGLFQDRLAQLAGLGIDHFTHVDQAYQHGVGCP